MKKLQFSLCAVLALRCVAGVVSVVRARYYTECIAIDGTDSVHTVYDNNGQYPYNTPPTYVQVVHSEYVVSYNSWSSQYDDNLSDWSDWSSFATADEKATVTATLADQYTQLGNLNTAVGDLGSYATDADSQYSNYVSNFNGFNYQAAYGYIVGLAADRH